jgi:hypothetical protein
MDSDTQKTNADPQHWFHHEQRDMYCKKSKLNKNRIELTCTTLEKQKSRIPDRKFRESSVVDPIFLYFYFILFYFFPPGSGPYFDLNFGSGFESGSGLFMKNTLEIHDLSIAKKLDCLEKFI